MTHVPFNKPFEVGTEAGHIARAIELGQLSSGGHFTRLCSEWLEQNTGSESVMLTPSCTASLEMAAILADLEPGDEIIMPSFTFVTTASAFALRGAVPVFVDIRADTLNLDETLIEQAVTERTKAIVPVHYAGISCEMDEITEIARRHGLMVIEDAAQGLMSSYRGRPLGTMGSLGAMSFHETKNVTCGEGGALLVNDTDLVARAELVRDKGTNRSRFYRGETDKYTWVELGSSYGLSELNAAFLWGQLQDADKITERRLNIWNRYHDAFEEHERLGLARRPIVPDGCQHNAHLYYLLLPSPRQRSMLLAELADAEVNAVFHYVPLHSSPAGLRYGRTAGSLAQTDSLSARLVRLPLWAGMPDEAVDAVVEAVVRATDRSSSEIAG